MTLHCYTLTCFTSNICTSSSDLYAVMGGLCSHNLDCGNAVDPPHIHIWGCEDVEDVC